MNLDDFTVEDKPIVAKPTTPSIRVPNCFPTLTHHPYKIAIIGEAPGKDEEYRLKPFVGYSGRLLDGLLSKACIVRDACFIGNICQFRPPNNDITLFDREGSEISDGLERLSSDLAQFDPNVVLLLGKTALWAAKGVSDIGNWRGSFFVSERPGPFYGRKCLASYHPAACLRQYEWTPLLMMDIQKVKADAETKELVLPIRELRVELSFVELINELDKVINDKPKISPDIEGGLNSLSCCSIALSPEYSFIIPFTRLDGTSYWSEDEELQIWDRFAKIMWDSQIKKTFQNGLYDRFVLQYGYNIIVMGNEDDTMVKGWEMYCELEKSLAFLASVLTKEPFWKHQRKEALAGH